MKSISGKKLCKIVEKLGWQLKRVTGSHHIYTKDNKEVILANRREAPHYKRGGFIKP